jgi:hypothetical protein
LQTHHYSLNEYGSSHVASVIVETLNQTKNHAPINLLEIAQAARTTSDMAREVLTHLTGLEHPSGEILDPSSRFRIALHAVRLGAPQQVARALTWREFEEFSEECLSQAGFKTHRGLVFKDAARGWQIDITAVKNHVLLAVDCKHWEPPNHSSMFNRAVEHQKQSLTPVIRHMRGTGELDDQEVSALPVIVTLFDPQATLLDKVVIVSVVQLPELLEHLTPYDPQLPFISDRQVVESPIW